jgi:polar amino acid transport system substrate-binding protein
MMKQVPAFLLSTCLTILSSVVGFADTLTLKADFWMPHNGDGKTETGYMLDIAKAVFEPKGHKIVFVMTPWENSLADVRSGKCNAVIGAGLEDAPDLVYPEEEQGLSIQLFCVKAGNPWKYGGVESLKTVKLGVIKDYTYFQAVDDYIKASPAGVVFGTGDNPLESNLARLLNGEVGAVVDDRSVLKYTIAKMKLFGKVAFALSTAEATKSSKLFIAFSPKIPKSHEYAKLLTEGMVTLRKSGELQKILAKYGLTDWK